MKKNYISLMVSLLFRANKQEQCMQIEYET